jgi:hypothetical protein
MTKEEQQWRVIAQPIVTLVFHDPVIAATPQEAVDVALERVNLYALFQGLSKLVQSDFADGFDGFTVDPIGEDGEPDEDHAVWLHGDGETPARAYLPQPPYWLPETALRLALRIAQAVLADEQSLDYVRTWTAGIRDVDAGALQEARKEIVAGLARVTDNGK